MWYYDSGYFNVDRLYKLGRVFNFVVGGRGTGKTYGSLKFCIENKKRFVYLRRTQTEVDLISQPKYNPCAAVADDLGIDIEVRKDSRYTAEFRVNDAVLGYSMALSTVSHVRGFDAHDIEVIIYDEFIPESHVRPIRNEADALFNAYETINRNRELQGRTPVLLWCFANANMLDNPVFMSLRLVERVVKMQNQGIEEYIDNDRSICIVLLNQSPISSKKRNTALYKIVHGSEFEKMAIDNSVLINNNDLIIGSKPIKEYLLLCRFGEACLYRHRSDGSYYISAHCAGTTIEFGLSDTEKKRFLRRFYYVIDAYMNLKIKFESKYLELYFTSYVNI